MFKIYSAISAAFSILAVVSLFYGAYLFDIGMAVKEDVFIIPFMCVFTSVASLIVATLYKEA